MLHRVLREPSDHFQRLQRFCKVSRVCFVSQYPKNYFQKLKNVLSIAVDFGGGSFKLSHIPLERGPVDDTGGIASVLWGNKASPEYRRRAALGQFVSMPPFFCLSKQ